MSQFDYKSSYRRNLPHLQPPGVRLFLTFRLAGSLPTSVLERWQEERKWLSYLEKTNPAYFARAKLDFEREWFAKFESVLDGAASGPLWLKDEQVADLVADSFHYRDGSVYRLDAFSIMPNHAHMVFKPLLRQAGGGAKANYPSLASIMQSLKGFTARECNRLLGRHGEFWAHESFDHYIRDQDEWMRIVAYVLNNPVKAGYVNHWQEWKWNYRRPVIEAETQTDSSRYMAARKIAN